MSHLVGTQRRPWLRSSGVWLAPTRTLFRLGQPSPSSAHCLSPESSSLPPNSPPFLHLHRLTFCIHCNPFRAFLGSRDKLCFTHLMFILKVRVDSKPCTLLKPPRTKSKDKGKTGLHFNSFNKADCLNIEKAPADK